MSPVSSRLTRLFALLALLAGSAHADVYLIHNGSETNYGHNNATAPSGSYQNSLHQAIAGAQSGDTIEIRDNLNWQYVGNNGYTINVPNLTLQGGSGYSPVIQALSAGTNAIFYVNAQNFTVRNLTIDSTSSLYGSYAFQMASKISGSNAYTGSGLSIDHVTMLGVRGALNAGSGSVNNFSFTNNVILNTRYGLGKQGLNIGTGTSEIEGNVFTNNASGGRGAPDGAALATADDYSIWIESLAGALTISGNTFNLPTGDYGVYSTVATPVDVSLISNLFYGTAGGSGAPYTAASLASGYGIGLASAPFYFAESPVVPEPGIFALLAAAGLAFAWRRAGC